LTCHTVIRCKMIVNVRVPWDTSSHYTHDFSVTVWHRPCYSSITKCLNRTCLFFSSRKYLSEGGVLVLNCSIIHQVYLLGVCSCFKLSHHSSSVLIRGVFLFWTALIHHSLSIFIRGVFLFWTVPLFIKYLSESVFFNICVWDTPISYTFETLLRFFSIITHIILHIILIFRYYRG